MGKFCSIFLTLTLLLTACHRSGDEITVISREEGSGTRSAFIALTGLEEEGEDRTYLRSEISSATAVVLQSVKGDKNAIGYLSVGAVSEGVKALKIDGAAPSAENIAQGSYPLARSFYLVSLDTPGAAETEFLRFVLSRQGQAVVAQEGYVPTEGGDFESKHPQGALRIAGSGSVAPVMEALVEAYGKQNPALRIEIQISDSSTGLSSLSVGLCDLAMSSRELTQQELARGLRGEEICRDGIAVIVHGENPVDGLTMAQLRGIFMGQLRYWQQVAQ